MPDGVHVDPGWAPAIGAALFRGGDALGLTLAAQVGLELGKHAEHVEERIKNALPAAVRCPPAVRWQRDGHPCPEVSRQ